MTVTCAPLRPAAAGPRPRAGQGATAVAGRRLALPTAVPSPCPASRTGAASSSPAKRSRTAGLTSPRGKCEEIQTSRGPVLRSSAARRSAPAASSMTPAPAARLPGDWRYPGKPHPFCLPLPLIFGEGSGVRPGRGIEPEGGGDVDERRAPREQRLDLDHRDEPRDAGQQRRRRDHRRGRGRSPHPAGRRPRPARRPRRRRARPPRSRRAARRGPVAAARGRRRRQAAGARAHAASGARGPPWRERFQAAAPRGRTGPCPQDIPAAGLAVGAARLHPDPTSNASVLQPGRVSWRPEEDDMSSTLTTTCPLCGLRFPGRPLLDLHIRDDHRERDRSAEPAPGDSAHRDSAHRDPAGTGAPRGGAGGTADEEVTATTAKPEPRPGGAMAALRRAIGALRPPARAGPGRLGSPAGRAGRTARGNTPRAGAGQHVNPGIVDPRHPPA